MASAPSRRKRSRKSFQPLSLRLTLIVPFVVQITAAVGLVGYLSFINAQHAIGDLSEQLLEQTDQLVAHHLDLLLADPHHVNQEITDLLEMQLLDRNDLAEVGEFLWRQTKRHAGVSYINYGLITGEYAGAGHYGENNSLSISETSAKTQWKNFNYSTDANGNRVTLFEVSEDYDYREEAWYQDALRAEKPVWSDIYLWDDNENNISLAAARPLFDRTGKLIGAIGVDLRLSQIQEYLQTLDFSPSGKIFIVERDGKLIATSSSESPYRVVNDRAERISAEQSSDPTIQRTAQFLKREFGSFATVQQLQTIEMRIERDRYFIRMMPWRDRYGLDWLVVITMPESDFMEQVNDNAKLTFLLCFGALVVTIAIGMITARRLMQPIVGMIRAADSLSQNNWQHPIPDFEVRELAQLARAFNQMANQIQHSFQQLAFTAHHDALTGLLNRRAFEQKLQEAIAKRQHSPDYQFAVLFLDLDYFKLINDSYGHLVGDQLLITVTQRLQDCVRETDPIARFGGDEFTILLEDITNPEIPIQIAQRIIKTLQESFDLNGREVFISTSIGIVLSTLMSDNAADLLRDADTALYRAKAGGKANYEVFNREMHTAAVERLQLETDLRRAIDRSEFVVYYQPIFDIVTGQMIGFEALVRWQHPQRGLTAPDKFIPLAEETGLIAPLGQWVVQQACQQMRMWQQEFQLDASLTMSVNISSKQILHIDFVSQLEQALQKTQLSPQSLKLEITESSFLSYEEITRIKFEQIKQLGVQISIDDFGTGYSALSYLHRLPVHTLKIDRSFVSRLGAHGKNVEIVEAIVMLAHKLGIEVVAEGVETSEQSEQLRVIHCTQAQGYLFSPPIPAPQIAERLKVQQLSHSPQPEQNLPQEKH